MDGRFILMTGVVVFGWCVPHPVSSTTSISNGSSIETFTRHSIDDLLEFVTENSTFLNNTIIDLVPNDFIGIVSDNTTDIVHDNITDIVHDNITDIVHDNITDIVHDNITDIVHDNITDIVHDNITDIVPVNITDIVPVNITDIVINNNFTASVVIDNSTKLITGNLTKFNIDNSTKLIFDNSTGAKLIGPNVCTFIKNYETKKIITKYEIHSSKTSYFCFKNWKFVCYFVTETAVPIQTEISENNLQIINTCCNGYEKTPNGAKCRPACKEPCVWGVCISPNVCSCDEYYDGPTCRNRIGCPSGKFGFDCTQTCQCQNNATCNYLNGDCSCQQGYWGKYCEDPCPDGYYGHKCQNICKCRTGAKCDPVNGACKCLPGYTGTNCELQCPPGSYGPKCQSECKYQNGTKCDIVNGNCTCLPGYEEYDAKLKECDCQKGTLCNSVNVTCSCQPGHIENNCEFTCPLGYYGKTCQYPCKCQNGAKCDAVNGNCYCSPGFTGEYCSLTCPSGLYGYQCQYECKCQNGAICDPVIGSCVCEPGLTGKECENVCPPGTYGVDCNSTCRCQNESKCRVSDGVCLCEPGFSGPTCSEDDSECINALQLEPINNEAVWIFDILVILSFLIMSTICMAVMMCCYYYCNRRQIQKCNTGNVNSFELRKSTNIESNPNIEVICGTGSSGMNIGNDMLESRKAMTSWSNETFYNNYARDNSVDDSTGENLYLEIDESTFNRAEDLYDHLDFLRPTVSWKPHYQSALVFQDQSSSNSSKKGETT